MSLVELARYHHRVAADVDRIYLESEGIDAVLFDAEMNNFGWGPMMPVRLMVLEEDRDRATALLAALPSGSARD